MPSPALLVLNKEGSLAIVEPATRKVVGHVQTGESPHEVVASTDRMEASLSPPAPATSTSAATTATTGYTGGAAASSATAQCESGGSYTAVNPAGYYGAYQFDQSTWDAYAPSGYQGVNPASAPPAVQDQAAASVPYDAWPKRVTSAILRGQP